MSPAQARRTVRLLRPARSACAVLLVAATILSGCMDRPAPPPAVVPDQLAAAVRFIVVGDTGTGDENEYAVARAIGAACQQRGCDFVVHTGDILYDVGPFSVDDTQFEDKFEVPYGSLGLPVYLVLGNHDVGGDPSSEDDLDRWKEIGDRSVAYANRTDRTTDAWRMPARWYNFTHGPAAFAAFDTSAFSYVLLESDPAGPLHRAVTAQETFAATAWPANATWRFAVGHHPYISNGKNGDAEAVPGPLHGRVLDWFYESHVCGKADVLLVGHDHDLQWLQPVPSCGSTRFLVSGAGARPRPLADPLRNAALFQQGDVLGFWWLEVHGDRLRLAAIDSQGTVLYEGDVLKAAPSSSASAASSAATG
jgi:tartrate-resistant acid phosphatase type 5